MEDQIKEALEAAKVMIGIMSEDQKLLDLTAKLSKKYLDSYIKAGFTREEAVQLVAAISAKDSN